MERDTAATEKVSHVANMDCMEFMKQFPDKFFDLAVVDPPYGIDKAFHATCRVAKYGQMNTVNDLKPNADYFDELFRVSKNQIIWGYNHISDMLPSCKEFIFWYKHQPVKTYSDGELAWTSFGKCAKCFDFPFFGGVGKEKNRIHPTQKPVALYRWIYENYAGGYRILDTHLGSGSSRIAAWHAGLDFWGCELDKEYFDKANERFEKEIHGVEVIGQQVIQQLSIFE